MTDTMTSQNIDLSSWDILYSCSYTDIGCPVIEVSSKGPNKVGVSPPLTWGRKQIQFPKRCVL
jgi:hypothetical protein